MHYLIDGYNLLFRTLHDDRNLQSQREAVIRDLNQKVSLVKINVSIIFDSTFQIGDRERSHYDHLEILYSAYGETADEYILDEIKNHPQPQQEIVVTSDKGLAYRVRNRLAHTESVEEFTLWLNQAYKNKIRQIRHEKNTRQPLSVPPLKQVSRSPVPSKDAPLEAYSDYYAEAFESKWQDILMQENEAGQQSGGSNLKGKRPPRRPKKEQDPFDIPQNPEEKAASEMERWQKIFENRLPDHKSKKK